MYHPGMSGIPPYVHPGMYHPMYTLWYTLPCTPLGTPCTPLA